MTRAARTLKPPASRCAMILPALPDANASGLMMVSVYEPVFIRKSVWKGARKLAAARGPYSLLTNARINDGRLNNTLERNAYAGRQRMNPKEEYMRRITLIALVALTGCLKPHNVTTAPTPLRAATPASHSAPVIAAHAEQK